MCKFVFRPSLWSDNLEAIEEKWECPYPSLPRVDYCIFHVSPSLRNKLLPTQSAKLASLRNAILSENRLHIICSTWERFNLDFAVRFLPQNTEIQIGCSSFWEFNAQDATIQNDIHITNSWFNKFESAEAEYQAAFEVESSQFQEFTANVATFRGRAFFRDCRFIQSDFVETEFFDKVQFCGNLPSDAKVEDVPELLGEDHSVFVETANFLGTDFYGSALFAGCEFHKCGQFMESDFRDGVSFEGVECDIGINFNSARFRHKASFDHAELGWANFKSTTFEDLTWFRFTEFGGRRGTVSTPAVRNHSTFEGFSSESWSEGQKIFDDPLLESFIKETEGWAGAFPDCRNQGRLMFHSCVATAPVSLRQADLGYIELEFDTNRPSSSIVLDKSTVDSGLIRLDEENNGYYQLSDTVLGNVDLEYSGVNPFKHLFIERTVFERFNFTDYRSELEDINWKIDGVIIGGSHQESKSRESTYALAREGADKVGDVLSTSKFFIVEQRIRRSRNWDEAKEGENTFLNRVSKGAGVFTDIIYDLTSKYAESPGRVAVSSLSVISGFSVLYTTLNPKLPYTTTLPIPSVCVGGLKIPIFSPHPGYFPGFPSLPLLYPLNVPQLCSPDNISGLEYLSFSLQSFTSFLIPGSSPISNPVVRFASSFESLLGAFFIGLFVATVVRSVEW